MMLFVFAAALLAGEMPISQPDVIPVGGSDMLAVSPGIVAGDGFLVVWAEHQLPLTSLATVKVRTYDPDGTPRQAVPLTIGQPGQSMTPYAFWNGSEYVVVHGSPVPKFGGPTERPVVFATRVRPDGTLVEGSQKVLATSPSGGPVHELAFDGTQALVLVSTPQLRLLTLDRDGTLLSDAPATSVVGGIAPRPGGGFFLLPEAQGDAIAAGGDRFAAIDLHAGEGGRGVIARILDAAGHEIERFLLNVDDGVSASIAWNGRAWVAVYTTQDVICTVQFTRAADLAGSCEAVSFSLAAIAAGERRTFKAWTNGAQLMTDSGVASTVSSIASGPDAVVDGAGLLAAWTETTTAGRSIRIGGIFNDGTPRPEHGAPAGPSAHSAALSRSASQTLLLWNQNGISYATRIGPDGVPVDPPLRVADGSRHSVASHGEEWVVAWMTNWGIEVARITRDFQRVKTEEFGRKLLQQAEPAIGATGSGYLVAWPEYSLIEVESVVFIEPLDAQGRRTSAGKFIPAPGGVRSLSMECGPAACALAGYESRGLWIALVRHDGTLIGAPRAVVSEMGNGLPAIEAFGDGSFRVYDGNHVIPVSPGGEPSAPRRWHGETVVFGEAVTWRGRVALVYERAGGVFAMDEPAPRMRSVRR